MSWDIVFKLSTAGFGGIVGFLFGGWSVLLQVLFIFMIVDQASGLMASYMEGKLSSKVGFKGIAKKVSTIFVIVVAHQIDQALMAAQVTSGSIVRDATIFFYIGNELLSFVENAGRMGVPLPVQILNAVAVLKGKGEGK